MAVGLAAASAALYWGTGVVLRGQLDQALGAAAFLAEEQMREADPAIPEPVIAGAPASYARLVNRYIALRSPDGAVLHALPDTAAGLPVDTAALRAAMGGERVWVNEYWHGEGIRSVYYPVPHRGVSGDVVLQVAASLRPVVAVQRDLLVALSAVVLFGAAATLFGAWKLAGSATRPVMEITEQATTIEVGTLGQRITAHADTEEHQGLVAVLNRMLERLDRAFHAQQRLTADVSHELRTPLTALRGEVEVALRAERSPERYRHVLSSAIEEIDRLTELTEDLLLVTRAEGRIIQPHRAPTDVNALVRGALEALKTQLDAKQVMVSVSLGSDLAEFMLDARLMSRVVHQLIENAAKFTPRGGQVRVGTSQVSGHLEVAVEDSGAGIAPQDLPHLFEPFYRADPARSSGDGTGLGLTVAAAIVCLHGGTITASNLAGGGARFRVALPT
jgi:heavy metal sensor kinase